MDKIINGKATAKQLLAEVKADVAALREQGVELTLAVVVVGDDPASAVYVRNKARACRRAGIRSLNYELPAETTQDELLALIDEINADPTIHGLLVQFPLPGDLSQEVVERRIDPLKDVDGFHPENVGLLAVGRPRFVPCTPAGIIHLLDRHDVELTGARAVVIGRSTLVGRPIASLLIRRHATVTVCHSRTRDLPRIVSEADLVVAAVGRAGLVRGDWIRPGAVVVDVGINRQDDGTLVGDVAFDEAAARARLITPVPGGVGPMTIASLLKNTVNAYHVQQAER